VLATSGISTSTASTASVAGVYPKIADVIQQVNTATGGLKDLSIAAAMHQALGRANRVSEPDGL
jgi:hypothetical protein